MRTYVEEQVRCPRKQWIYEILEGTREKEAVLVETADMIFLPDTEARNDKDTVNWLAIIKDRSLRSLRDLRGEHADMLQRAQTTCVDYILNTRNFDKHDVMAYIHYLPSVFQLHIHFCAPYGSYTARDAIYKLHPLDNVISNLRIDSDYYRKAHISTVVTERALIDIYSKEEIHEAEPVSPQSMKQISSSLDN
ncbi:hypothetical protein GUITHDRAFT_137339 [Guillardia theta CCMP2712]|uniref:HIT domain-containing protein n=1 Tax=Guillardia theta (strain CCMP2712) TaxID=905079 RepID=L1JHI3_GUITC|nr:hypothetical protein GUITHDRAFT_137339 [Guillardia theta CCMP2712]EKX47560.1 hypothetical protein GUITHDRAFT_137339 [Guillardia theta CCMP2712]|eukprot:XP_005834540.1 hypothetical protein GUITHDRAFT_137339 [Guillardia theta CCMP2712]